MEAARRVRGARELQQRRQQQCNARLGPEETLRHCIAEPAGMVLLREASRRLGHSARSQHRILRVARTIADLAGRELVLATDMAEALAFRWSEQGIP